MKNYSKLLLNYVVLVLLMRDYSVKGVVDNYSLAPLEIKGF